MEQRKFFKILVVEDNSDDAVLLVRELRRAGYDIDHTVVCSESDLRKQLHLEKWDCITSDHLMPGFSAPEAIRVAQEVAPEIPIVVVSGEVNLDLAVKLTKLGADDYVRKSELGSVAKAIKDAVNRKREPIETTCPTYHLGVAERIFQAYYNLPLVGVVVYDTQTQYYEFNAYLCQMLGYAVDEITEQVVRQLLPQQDYQKLIDYLNNLIATEAEGFELNANLRRADGTLMETKIAGVQIVDDATSKRYVILVVVERH